MRRVSSDFVDHAENTNLHRNLEEVNILDFSVDTQPLLGVADVFHLSDHGQLLSLDPVLPHEGRPPLDVILQALLFIADDVHEKRRRKEQYPGGHRDCNQAAAHSYLLN